MLLSLVFYLQVLSEYIPKGYSRIPLLTLYALGNFVLVLISCICTVFILRLYYRPPSYKSCNQKQVPYCMRVFFFKWLARILMLKFYCRGKEDLSPQGSNSNKHLDQKELIVNLETLLDPLVSSNSSTKANKESQLENCAKDLLKNLKLLNKSLSVGHKPLESLSKSSTTNNHNQPFSIYIEEWKQVALILDRYIYL